MKEKENTIKDKVMKSDSVLLKGNIDACDEHSIRGWVIDEADANHFVELSIFIDDELVTKTTANIFRQDLLVFGNGRYAFETTIPNRFFDNADHKAKLVSSLTDEIITESFFNLKEQVIDNIKDYNIVIDSDKAIDEDISKLYGYVETVDDSGISGWLVNLKKIDNTNKLEIFIGDLLVGETDTNIFRLDLPKSISRGGIKAGFLFNWKRVNIKSRKKLYESSKKNSYFSITVKIKDKELYLNSSFGFKYEFKSEKIIDFVEWNSTLVNKNSSDRLLLSKVAEFFDSDFYLRKYEDIRLGAINPLNHYFYTGAYESREPCEWFDEVFYRTEVKEDLGDMPAFFHWVLHGNSRKILPAKYVITNKTGRVFISKGHQNCYVCETIRPFLNAPYYGSLYSNVKGDLLAHYCEHGWKELRNPSADFDTKYYLTSNRDVSNANINPLYHYVVAGKKEGRHSKVRNYIESTILDDIMPASKKVNVKIDRSKRYILTSLEISEILEDNIGKDSGLIFSFGHDVYVNNIGGIQIFTSDEQKLMNDIGYMYIHFAPEKPSLGPVEDKLDLFYVNITVNGLHFGVANMKEVFSVAIDYVKEFNYKCLAVVHAIHGYDLSQLGDTLSEYQDYISDYYYFVHDYVSLCDGFQLLRNEVEYCNYPELDSNSCKFCINGVYRRKNHLPIFSFFEKIKPIVVAPSEKALEIWNKAGLNCKEKQVVPHIKFNTSNRSLSTEIRRKKKIKIAFLGYPNAHKGWLHFLSLAEQFFYTGEYEFYLFGSHCNDVNDPRVSFVRVDVTGADRFLMVEKLKEYQINCCFIGSIWPETYCYTMYESLMARAIVLCFANSGNVADYISKNKAGFIYETVSDLIEDMVNFEQFKNKLSSIATYKYEVVGFGSTAALIKS